MGQSIKEGRFGPGPLHLHRNPHVHVETCVIWFTPLVPLDVLHHCEKGALKRYETCSACSACSAWLIP